jgi:hypothetical protein
LPGRDRRYRGKMIGFGGVLDAEHETHEQDRDERHDA